MLLPAPGVVYVIEPRIITSVGARTYLARSTDGGRTFGPAVAIAPVGYEESALGPNGSIAFSAGPTTLRAGLFSPTGGSFRQPGSALGPFLEGTFNDVASNGTQTLAAGSDAGITHAFRLPPGGDPNIPAAWQQIDPARGYREPALASLPGAFAAMLEPVANFAQLAVAAPRARGLVAAGADRPRRQQLRVPPHEQHPRPPERRHRLLRLPPALRDLDRRRRAVVLARRRRQLGPRVRRRPAGRDATRPAPARP